MKQEAPFQRKSMMVELIKDVVSSVLSFDSEKLDLEASFQVFGQYIFSLFRLI
jgi:hypothetical protein